MIRTNDNLRTSCEKLQKSLLSDRKLIIVANRGPVTFNLDENGERTFLRSTGGLVTALTGLAKHVDATWIAAADTDEDRKYNMGEVPLDGGGMIRVRFVDPDPAAYEAYYHVISNPLLWFLQHNMWDGIRTPTIDQSTWQAWYEGYVAVNQLFADKVVDEISASKKPVLVMLQDYHLYLAPQYIRQKLRGRKKYTLMHFVHIPWPGSEDWGILPSEMRRSILEGLCAVDLLGFQTREDTVNFLRTGASYMLRASFNFKRSRIWSHNHATHVRDFPISIDVDALCQLAASAEVASYQTLIQNIKRDRKLILRIDRTEPSKNIVRGFKAFGKMLELHPEHIGNTIFLGLLVPSRLGVDEYKNYLDEIMAAAGRVNSQYGSSEWEPIRILIGEDYPRAVAAMKQYDVLLVNSIADGMNLVAKEGPIVNQVDGVVVLSEHAGARQQLEVGAKIISPYDIYATAEALHTSLIMSADERTERATRLRWIIERNDISDWLCRQLETLKELRL